MAGSTCGGAGRRTKGEPAMFLSGTGSEFGTGGTRWGPVVEVFAGVQHSVNRGKALRPKTAASLATIDEEAPKPDGQVTPGKSPYHP
jgi:hypothetical protein